MSASSGHWGALQTHTLSCFLYNGDSFESMRDLDVALPLHRINAPMIQKWFGDMEGLPDIDQLVWCIFWNMMRRYMLTGLRTSKLRWHTLVTAAPSRMSTRFSRKSVRCEVWACVCFPFTGCGVYPGPAFISCRCRCVHVNNSHNSLFDVFEPFVTGPRVNSNMGFATAPPCKLGHVLRDVIRRILYLRPKNSVGTPALILERWMWPALSGKLLLSSGARLRLGMCLAGWWLWTGVCSSGGVTPLASGACSRRH